MMNSHLMLIDFWFWITLAVAQTLPSLYNFSSVLSQQNELTKFSSILSQFPSLWAQLETGNLTVLAPSNDAFARYYSSANATGHDTDRLAALLTYHVLNGVYPQGVFNSTPKFIPTLLNSSKYANVSGGQRVEAEASDNGLTFYSAVRAISKVVTPDIIYSEKNVRGVIHVIDSVLVPPIDMITTITKARLSGYLALIAEFPPSPDWAGALGGSNDWTIFATNISLSDVQSIDPHAVTQEQTFAIQDYNCVPGEVAYSSFLTDGRTFQAVRGGNVTITVQHGTIYVNDAKVIGRDYLISTGVMQVTDRILDPNNTNARPGSNSTISTSSIAPGATHPSTSTVSAASGSTLSPASKAGIGVGVAIGAIVIAIVIWYFVHVRKLSSRKRQKSRPIASELSRGEENLTTELDGKCAAAELGGQKRRFEMLDTSTSVQSRDAFWADAPKVEPDITKCHTG